MKTEKVEVSIEGNKFEYNGNLYDIEFAIKKDIENITMEARAKHPDSFEIYDFDKLKPNFIRLSVFKGEIVYGIIIYTIPYKDGTMLREACGTYILPYCFEGKNVMMSHLYQGRICW